MDLSELVLQNRGANGACNVDPLPAAKWPPYSITIGGTFDANGNGTATFTAERDTLFAGLTVDTTGGVDNARVYVDASYCNTKLLVHSSARTWKRCCDRKPIFLQGVSENKTLKFNVSGGTPDDQFSITLFGVQGNGCC